MHSFWKRKKDSQYIKKKIENEILSQKENITSEKVMIIEIIFLICLPAG